MPIALSLSQHTALPAMSTPLRQTSDNWLALDGQVCVVTGGGSGIGECVAHQLAAYGAHVAVMDRDGEKAVAVAAAIEHAGGRALGIEVDVTEVEAVASAASRIRAELGSCRALVNNAAVVGSGVPLMQLGLVQWDRMIGVNLTGALICAQVFSAQMVSSGTGGSIVNVASICGHAPLVNGGAYSVSKAGLIMLTRMLAVELGTQCIRCNSVSPGLVRTPATETIYSDSELARARESIIPSGRIADPSDVANTVAFLSSERASYINGQDILVDGGLKHMLMGLVPMPIEQMRPART